MKIDITIAEGVPIVAISGEIDMSTSTLLRTHLLELVGEKRPLVLIDFTYVSYIDSSGIATFVEGLKGMMHYGGKLKFVAIPANIAEIFSFSKLDKVFEMYGSVNDVLDR
ncbi:MAG: STAS domain-containing protein [Nitrospirae bacterium]|nr:STAS domain-containing protein [Nitrospirota bacterium]